MADRWLYVYAFSLLLVDIFSAAFLERYIIYGLLCFYACLLFRPTRPNILALIILLISLEQFIILGHFGIPLLYILPATAIAFKARLLFYSQQFPRLIVTLFCLVSQLLIINPLIFGLFDRKIYTMATFFVSILLVGLFSLKFKSTES